MSRGQLSHKNVKGWAIKRTSSFCEQPATCLRLFCNDSQIRVGRQLAPTASQDQTRHGQMCRTSACFPPPRGRKWSRIPHMAFPSFSTLPPSPSPLQIFQQGWPVMKPSNCHIHWAGPGVDWYLSPGRQKETRGRQNWGLGHEKRYISAAAAHTWSRLGRNTSDVCKWTMYEEVT